MHLWCSGSCPHAYSSAGQDPTDNLEFRTKSSMKIKTNHLHGLHDGTLLHTRRFLTLSIHCFIMIVNPISPTNDGTLRTGSNVESGVELLLVNPFTKIKVRVSVSYSLNYICTLSCSLADASDAQYWELTERPNANLPHILSQYTRLTTKE